MKINLYETYYELYKNKKISERIWQNFCTDCLVELMEEDAEVLKRLGEGVCNVLG